MVDESVTAWPRGLKKVRCVSIHRDLFLTRYKREAARTSGPLYICLERHDCDLRSTSILRPHHCRISYFKLLKLAQRCWARASIHPYQSSSGNIIHATTLLSRILHQEPRAIGRARRRSRGASKLCYAGTHLPLHGQGPDTFNSAYAMASSTGQASQRPGTKQGLRVLQAAQYHGRQR